MRKKGGVVRVAGKFTTKRRIGLGNNGEACVDDLILD
jgi:hypothetical protein